MKSKDFKNDYQTTKAPIGANGPLENINEGCKPQRI